MIPFRKSTALSLVLLSLALAGCEPADKDLLISFAKEWGKLHGLYDEKGNLTGKAIARGAAQNLPDWAKPDVRDANDNVDPAGNAVVDAGSIIMNMKDTDKLVDESKKELKETPPDTATALENMNVAVRARPNDWYYLNRRGYINAISGNEAAAGKDFEAAENACAGNRLCIEAADRDRENVLNRGM